MRWSSSDVTFCFSCKFKWPCSEETLTGIFTPVLPTEAAFSLDVPSGHVNGEPSSYPPNQLTFPVLNSFQDLSRPLKGHRHPSDRRRPSSLRLSLSLPPSPNAMPSPSAGSFSLEGAGRLIFRSHYCASRASDPPLHTSPASLLKNTAWLFSLEPK